MPAPHVGRLSFCKPRRGLRCFYIPGPPRGLVAAGRPMPVGAAPFLFQHQRTVQTASSGELEQPGPAQRSRERTRRFGHQCRKTHKPRALNGIPSARWPAAARLSICARIAVRLGAARVALRWAGPRVCGIVRAQRCSGCMGSMRSGMAWLRGSGVHSRPGVGCPVPVGCLTRGCLSGPVPRRQHGNATSSPFERGGPLEPGRQPPASDVAPLLLVEERASRSPVDARPLGTTSRSGGRDRCFPHGRRGHGRLFRMGGAPL
jgi:hypothetical protein